jgi:antitoxin ParD1/3/4
VLETREKVDAAAVSLDRGEGVDGEEVVSLYLEKLSQARETHP